jgi:shikimate kinase
MCEASIILTGFMGSGKSSVGKVVSSQLGRSFIDLDEEIVKAAGWTINEIFARDGEQAFREIESFQLAKVLSSKNGIVLATGGGVVISAKNRELMRGSGVVVCLQVTLEQVMARISDSNDRPLLLADNATKRAETLLNEREHFYADADIRIDTDRKSVEDVAAEILCHLKGHIT